MSKRYLSIIAFLICGATMYAQNKYEKWGTQFVTSEITRHPEAWSIEYPSKGPKWNYTQGLEILSMQGWLTDEEWVRYARSYADSLINEKGVIKGFKMKDFKLDAVNSGKILFKLYDETKDRRYRIAMDTLYAQILRQPRTPEGGMWHKTIYPNQMWLDGQYMGLPFYLEYCKRYCTPAEYEEAYRFVCHQIQLIADHTLCPECKLFHHAWDAAHIQSWADKETGRSAHAWGRAEGWYMMAIIDCLGIRYDNNVLETAESDPLVSIFNYLADRIIPLQDKKTKTWQQVLDCTDMKGNYQEMTCSSMFAYSLLKGYRICAFMNGTYEAEIYRNIGKLTIDGIFKYFVKKDKKGLLSLKNCCAVAGLSDSRDGSFEYYLREKIVENDPKGLGPLFMALLELRTNP